MTDPSSRARPTVRPPSGRERARRDDTARQAEPVAVWLTGREAGSEPLTYEAVARAFAATEPAPEPSARRRG